MPAADHEGDDGVGVGVDIPIRGQRACRDGEARALAQARLEAVQQLVHAREEALVLVHQRVADEHARHAGILLREAQQCRDRGLDLLHRVLLLGLDLVDQAEDGLLDELDQALEHLRLAGEVAVERGLGNLQARREQRRGDALAFRVLQHRRERPQDLLLALPGLRHSLPPVP